MNSESLRDSVGGGEVGSSAEFFFSVTSKRHFQLVGPFFIFLFSRTASGNKIIRFSTLSTIYKSHSLLFSCTNQYL